MKTRRARGATSSVSSAITALAILVAVGALVWAHREGAEARHAMAGWNLIPVIVFNRALPVGTKVTPNDLAERSVPSSFVTSSVVRPGSVSFILRQPLLADVQAGDLVLWSQFVVRKQRCDRIVAACRDAAHEAVKSASAPANPKTSTEPSNKP